NLPQWIKANWPKEACWDVDGLLGKSGASSLTGWQLPHAVEKKASASRVTRVRRLDAMADWRVARKESAAAWKLWLLAWC
ncbi:hypothetical protein, partial [Pseudomonas aeruginosa]